MDDLITELLRMRAESQALRQEPQYSFVRGSHAGILKMVGDIPLVKTEHTTYTPQIAGVVIQESPYMPDNVIAFGGQGGELVALYFTDTGQMVTLPKTDLFGTRAAPRLVV